MREATGLKAAAHVRTVGFGANVSIQSRADRGAGELWDRDWCQSRPRIFLRTLEETFVSRPLVEGTTTLGTRRQMCLKVV